MNSRATQWQVRCQKFLLGALASKNMTGVLPDSLLQFCDKRGISHLVLATAIVGELIQHKDPDDIYERLNIETKYSKEGEDSAMAMADCIVDLIEYIEFQPI